VGSRPPQLGDRTWVLVARGRDPWGRSVREAAGVGASRAGLARSGGAERRERSTPQNATGGTLLPRVFMVASASDALGVKDRRDQMVLGMTKDAARVK